MIKYLNYYDYYLNQNKQWLNIFYNINIKLL